jgi:hypothetical protein
LPLCSSSSGDWPDRYARPLRYNTTITIKIQTLRDAAELGRISATTRCSPYGKRGGLGGREPGRVGFRGLGLVTLDRRIQARPSA